ncbi:APC family permease [Cellulomonas gilvus]|uniref:Amino acid permease-associated region n=1 Tax=Cellulomonas gilvus (strain ATCC 13127 / NRRL B-14078) TaxID=593907 RepID=F8A5D8_CELGA|nr:APC family permease [Cellulomonas gilvus]AEI10955.1 amino acid permease-associated region [Cellulomonas gilvus ATCC 13127]
MPALPTPQPGPGAAGPALRRALGVRDAVVVGLGAMLGAGVFAAFAPAARAAGTGLLIGLALAAAVAYANATSTAQLAAELPTSGGAYAFGRARLGPWWGYVAGWGFVVGKTSSCAAMALTFAAYVAPAGWERPVAAAAVVLLVVVADRGVTRTALVAAGLLLVVLVVLGVVVAAGATGGTWPPPGSSAGTTSVRGVLESAGLLFFAFAGYARIATLGEEVREPARTIPRAIPLALAIAVALYALVGVTVLAVLGPDGAATSSAPLSDAVDTVGWAWAVPVVGVGAAAASLGALLALVAGIGRTALAMAREGDLPRGLAAVDARHRVPARAQRVLGVVVVALVLTVDLRGAIGFSSFGVLTYYLIANLAAWRQPREHRRWPRALQAGGAAGCVLLALTLPTAAVVGGVAVLAVGVLVRLVRLRVAA